MVQKRISGLIERKTMKKTTLILLRHGESMWNLANLFTGWVDIPLSPKGIEEALAAGKVLAEYEIDVVFTSTLVRAMMTTMLALSEHPNGRTPVVYHDQGKLAEWGKIYSEKTRENILPVYIDDALNERMYGALQGLNKRETAEKFGAGVVHKWRRGYRDRPPEGESLELTVKRTMPYFFAHIEPALKSGKSVLVSAHGNSLRSIVKYLDKLDDEQILHCEIPTGIPIIYEYVDGVYEKRAS